MKQIFEAMFEDTLLFWRITPGQKNGFITSCFLMLLNSVVRLGALFAFIVIVRYAWNFDLSRIPF